MLAWVAAVAIHSAILVPFVTSAEAPAAPSENEAAPTTRIGEVRFHRNLADARAAAEREGKLVFYYQVVGNLEAEEC